VLGRLMIVWLECMIFLSIFIGLGKDGGGGGEGHWKVG